MLFKLATSLLGSITAYLLYKVLKVVYDHLTSPLRSLPGPNASHWLFGNLKDINGEQHVGLQEGWVQKYGRTMKIHQFLMFLTYSLIVDETIAAYREMIGAEGWENQDNIAVCNLAFIIIARCGFGLHMPWSDIPAPNSDMTFSESLSVVSSSAITRLVLPGWVYKLPIQKVKSLDQAWKTLRSFMHTFVDTRRTELNGLIGEDGHSGDIFSRLIAAMYKDADSKLGLEEQEVIGNMFTLLFAGRGAYLKAILIYNYSDTWCSRIQRRLRVGFSGSQPTLNTACAIIATLGFLAINQEEQATAYAEIMDNIPSNRTILDDLSKLPHLLACFHESIRMYPGGAMLTREMSEDVPIKLMCPVERTMVLKKGTLMVIEMIAVHHNPHVFPEPDEYRPSRWYGVSETDVPMFGQGPRACLGRKFSYTEALSFLVLFLRDWHLDVPLRSGETRAQFEERVMGRAGRVGMAFGCGPVALKLIGRK
ncbi:cytochrome P450 [Mycena galericulata]|nr:cytochrome P450 [Mycena galericulata]